MKARLAVLLAGLLISGACKDEPETPTSPTPTATPPRTVHSIGTLARGGSRSEQFTVSSAGNVTVMLASITSPATGTVLDLPLGLGVGRWRVEEEVGRCELITSLNTGPGLLSQIQQQVEPGEHCISVYDIGRLTGDVNFAIRYTYP